MITANSDLEHTEVCFLYDDLSSLNEYCQTKFDPLSSVVVHVKQYNLCKLFQAWKDNQWTFSISDNSLKQEDKLMFAIWTSMHNFVQENKKQVCTDSQMINQ